MAFAPIIPFFLFALFTYFMREQVYKTWVKFALAWLVVSIGIIAFAPDTSAPALGGPGFGIGKGDVALALTALFVIASVVLLAWKYVRK